MHKQVATVKLNGLKETNIHKLMHKYRHLIELHI